MAAKKKLPHYTTHQLARDLDGFPDADEIRRLVDYYPTYEREHRKGLLQGILDGTEHTKLVFMKMSAKGVVDPTPQQIGGHGRWVASKLRRTAIRLLYLRYTLDKGLTRKKALLELYRYDVTRTLRKDSIRYATRQKKKKK